MEKEMTADLVYRLRKQGLRLPTNRKFSNKRLGEIAIRQEQLFQELDGLDKEIIKIQEEGGKDGFNHRKRL